MNAFISWSGSRESLIARAVKEWLTAVAPKIDGFISPDLPKGGAWFDALAKSSRTPESVSCVWPRREWRASGSWSRKWHASAYYPTAHAIIACAGFEDDLARDSVEWMLNTQNSDGSWGTYLPTAEETAYALQALWVWNEKVARIPKPVFKNGARWLQDHLDQPNPPLCIGKCLYNPRLVIRSAVISALTLTR